jgi:hypothetical protein
VARSVPVFLSHADAGRANPAEFPVAEYGARCDINNPMLDYGREKSIPALQHALTSHRPDRTVILQPSSSGRLAPLPVGFVTSYGPFMGMRGSASRGLAGEGANQTTGRWDFSKNSARFSSA